MLKFTNNASATLAGSIASTVTSIILSSGNGALFPSLAAGEFFYVTLVDSSNNIEVAKVTSRSVDTLTVVRAQDGTTARAYSVGDKVELRLIAATFAELIQRDGSIPMIAPLNYGGFKGIALADPTVSTDAATKNYVDTVAVAAVNAEATNRSNADAAEVTARNAAIAAEQNRATAAEALLLPKAGGAVSGNVVMSGSAVIYSSQSGAADNARNTGYKMSDGQDIGEMNRNTQYYDDRASNCNGYLNTGNCSGNVQYTPPNGNWWEWYSGRSSQAVWANSGSFDGAGGTTYSYNAISVGFNYDGYYLAADEIGGGEYRRNYRNCNCGAFNCRTNCNCNCACCGNCGC